MGSVCLNMTLTCISTDISERRCSEDRYLSGSDHSIAYQGRRYLHGSRRSDVLRTSISVVETIRQHIKAEDTGNDISEYQQQTS